MGRKQIVFDTVVVLLATLGSETESYYPYGRYHHLPENWQPGPKIHFFFLDNSVHNILSILFRGQHDLTDQAKYIHWYRFQFWCSRAHRKRFLRHTLLSIVAITQLAARQIHIHINISVRFDFKRSFRYLFWSILQFLPQ